MDPIDVGLREVAGRVVDSRREGLEDVDVYVSVSGSPGVDSPDARTDDEGYFSASFLHAGGGVNVRARRSTEGMSASLWDVDPEDPSSTDLTIEFPSGDLSLLLQDEKTGQAVPDARVEFVIERQGLTSYVTRVSSPTGMVTVADLGAVKFEAEIRARGYETATVAAALRAGDTEVRQVRLRRSGKARARVLRPGGSAIQGATVAGPISRSIGYGEPPRVLTDSEGEFEIEAPAIGGGIFAIWSSGYRVTFVHLGAESDGRRVVLLERGLDTVLELVESDGSPIRGANVLISPGSIPLLAAGEFVEMAIEGCGARLPRTNREGQTALGGCLAPGDYQVGVRRIRGTQLVDDPVGAFTVPSPPVVRLMAPERSK